MIEIYKSRHGTEKMARGHFCAFPATLELGTIQRNCSAVHLWNSLPPHEVMADSRDGLKKKKEGWGGFDNFTGMRSINVY